MKYKNCVIVLIGEQTANRPWVDYEIRKAWAEGRGLIGIYIHNLKCPRAGTCGKGANPFEKITLENGQKLSSLATCYDPKSWDAYGDIQNNLSAWVEHAIANKR